MNYTVRVKPIITLNGSNPQEVNYGKSYFETGAYAIEADSSTQYNVTDITSNVDTENLESQQVDYNYTDSMSVYKSDGSFGPLVADTVTRVVKRY